MRGAFTVTHTCTNTCTGNSVAIKNLVKIVKYLEFLGKVFSSIRSNVVRSYEGQNLHTYPYYLLFKYVTLYHASSYGLPKTRPTQKQLVRVQIILVQYSY